MKLLFGEIWLIYGYTSQGVRPLTGGTDHGRSAGIGVGATVGGVLAFSVFALWVKKTFFQTGQRQVAAVSGSNDYYGSYYGAYRQNNGAAM